MNKIKFIFVVLITLTAFFAAWFFASDKPESNIRLIEQNNFLNDNKPVHLPGCQTYQRPVPKKVLYPAVRKNFVTRLCALEVPPPYGVIVMQRKAVQSGPSQF